jgi:hypothetical protein
MRAYLLIACVLPLLTASLPAAALDEDCGRVPSTAGREGDPFASYLPTIDSALSLPKEGVFALRLRPVGDVVYPVLPDRGSDGGFGGIVTLENIPAGRYRIVLSEEAWIDAVQGNARLPLLSIGRAIDCPGTRHSVQVEVKGEALMLQFGGATASKVKVAVLRIWPFEWKW